MKRMFWVLLLVLVPVLAQASGRIIPADATYANETKKFITFGEIAKELGMPVAQVMSLAPETRRTDGGLFRGERMLKRDIGLGPYTAIYHHQSEAVKDFAQSPKRAIASHLAGMRPNEARAVKQLIEKKVPTEDRQLQFGEVLESMAFWTQGKLVQLRNCIWWPVDKKYQPIPEVLAHRWMGTDWAWVDACYNVTQVKEKPPVPTPTSVPVVKKTSVPAPTPEETPLLGVVAQPEPTTIPNFWWGNGVLWVDGEVVNASSTNQLNSYDGFAWWWWRWPRLAPVLQAEFWTSHDSPDEGPATTASSFLGYVGLRGKIFYQTPVQVDGQITFGGRHDADNYAIGYWNYDRNIWDYQKGSASQTRTGVCGSIFFQAPADTFGKIEFSKFKDDTFYNADVSSEPGHWYVEGGASGSDEAARTNDDGQQYRQAGKFNESHFRLGYKLSLAIIVAATYQDWTYQSDIYGVDWNGPGVYVEWRLGAWRIKGQGTYFYRTDKVPGGGSNDSNERRGTLIITRKF